MVASDDPRIVRCGFCKLEGDVVDEFFCKRYEIVLGRRSKSTRLDVVLGEYAPASSASWISKQLFPHPLLVVIAFPARGCTLTVCWGLTGQYEWSSDIIVPLLDRHPRFRLSGFLCRRKHEHLSTAREDCLQF